MQKSSFVFALAVVVAGFCSCSHQPSTPMEVTRAFVKALIKGDNEDTKKLLSKKALQIIEKDDRMKGKFAEVLQNSVELTSPDKCLNEQIKGDRATVDCETKSGTLNVPLIKEDGKWKVHPPFADRE